MNKIFKQKLQDGSLEKNLNIIYDKLCILHANVGFLCSYCNLSLNVMGVADFQPFTKELLQKVEAITIDFQKIVGSEKGVREKNCFLPSELTLKKTNVFNIEKGDWRG